MQVGEKERERKTKGERERKREREEKRDRYLPLSDRETVFCQSCKDVVIL